MALEDIIREKMSRIDNVPVDFTDKVGASQSELFDILLGLLDELETSGGKLVFNDSNLATITQILDQYRELFLDTEYTAAVGEFAKQFDIQGDINDRMLKSLFDNYKRTDVLRDLLQTRKKGAIEALIGAPIDPFFFAPIEKNLTDAVSTSSTIPELTKAIKDIIMGDKERLGRLDRYTKQTASDLFAITDRSYTKSAADSLEVEFYRYVGGLLTDSRAFCADRNNKFYHRGEIEAWGAGSVTVGIENPTAKTSNWQGKINPTTASTIFTNLGGFNCKHAVIPVSTIAVPVDVLQRAINEGFFDPDSKERELLGL